SANRRTQNWKKINRHRGHDTFNKLKPAPLRKMVMLPSTNPVSNFVNKGFKKNFLLMTFMQWRSKIGDRKTLEVEASNGFDSVGNVIGLLTRDKEALGVIDFLARLVLI
ncbi:UNVERIFIED_CONTAM: hypothetical protein Sindi_1262700, partial [Sesamum indicum]